MRVVQVSPYYPPHCGGLENVVYNLTRRLRAKGHEVVVVTSKDRGQTGNFDKGVIRIPISFKMFNTPISLQLYFALKRINGDIIHSHAYPVYFSDVSWQIAQVKKIPYVIHWHMDPRLEPRYKKKTVKLLVDTYFRIIGNKVLVTADAIIVPSASIQSLLSENNSIELDRIHVFHSCVNTDTFVPMKKTVNRPVVLFAGRISRQKNLASYLKAWPNIVREIPEAELWIVGSCDQPDYLVFCRQLVRYTNNVKFLGFVPVNKLVDIYAQSDLVVLPSIYEASPLVALEALACKRLPICTPTGNLAQELNGCAVFVDPLDIEGWVKETVKYLTSTKERKNMAHRGYEVIKEKFRWEFFVTKLIELYIKLIEERGTR